MRRFDIRVDGIPKAQPRARIDTRGKFPRTYTPEVADDWKVIVVVSARAARPDAPIDGPVQIQLDFFLPRPKRLMRKADPDEVLPHPVKPDADNLEKAVLDALTADGWWIDDAQVYASTTRKFYARKTGRPGLQITILAP